MSIVVIREYKRSTSVANPNSKNNHWTHEHGNVNAPKNEGHKIKHFTLHLNYNFKLANTRILTIYGIVKVSHYRSFEVKIRDDHFGELHRGRSYTNQTLSFVFLKSQTGSVPKMYHNSTNHNFQREYLSSWRCLPPCWYYVSLGKRHLLNRKLNQFAFWRPYISDEYVLGSQL